MAVQYAEQVLKISTEVATGCQGLQPPFCSAECPMHTDAMGYVRLVGEGRLDDAVRKIRERVFLPGTLGRVCAHPCEDVCRRESEFGQPIAVAALKRYAADKADKEELWDLAVGQPTGKKVAIIGSGPAGAQAAVDLRKAGHDVTIFEKLPVVGGMMRVGIPNYRLPDAVLDFEYGYLTKLGVLYKMGIEVGKEIALTDLRASYDAVVLAHGAHKGLMPRVNGASSDGITNAVDFLRELAMTSKSTVLGKSVAVIGGGDVAIDCARSALRAGAEQVQLVTLEKEDELPASRHEQEGAREEGVGFLCGWCTEETVSLSGRVSSLRLKDCRAIMDESGQFNPRLGDQTKEINCDTVIFATGQLVEDISGGAIAQTKGGRYVVDGDTLTTAIPGVFVAGDAAGSTIVIQAMALGRKAALSVDRYLKGQDLATGRDFKSEYTYESKFKVPLEAGTENLKRAHTQVLSVSERTKTFAECDFGLNDEDALAEAQRCLHCECKKCMIECLMLNDFTRCPGELFGSFLGKGDIEPIVPYSCNMCNQCTLVCPEEYKMADIFAGMRKDMVKANHGKSPIKGHGAIDIHQKLSFSKMFTIKRKGRK
ncbi:MAG: NADPH-Fe(3+) oxidoreductase subunit beta [Firmicutes bacterium]|nr:NADPH-Fe(3+) oxidoreductase subunit beta [Bacillota bacterium]